MKIQKKLMICTACGFLMLTMSVGQSFAAAALCTATKITGASVTAWPKAYSSNYKITVNNTNCTGGADRVYYVMKSSEAKSYYATALTAMALNQQVEIYVSDTRANSLVNYINLTPTSN